jgi:hypothetical protein
MGLLWRTIVVDLNERKGGIPAVRVFIFDAARMELSIHSSGGPAQPLELSGKLGACAPSIFTRSDS